MLNMQAIVIHTPGEPAVMQLEQVDPPSIGTHEVLIKVSAAGVNRPDIMQRKGHYPAPADASPLLGLEVAGTISEVGTDVSEFQVGDEVCALVNGGGYAEFVNAPASQCLPIPKGWSMIEAASLPETYFTVWSNVFGIGKLQSGESLLVHGGSSGIGVAAIQMAVAMGATVYCTAGSAEKCEACVGLGASLAINYKSDDFEEILKATTSKQGVDVILDIVAGSYIQKNMSVAARGGRIIMIAFQGGHKAEVSFLPMLMKKLSLFASTLRPQTVTEKAKIATDLKQHIWPHLSSGKIKPVIAGTFPIAEAAAAHELMESSQHIGKIVLTL